MSKQRVVSSDAGKEWASVVRTITIFCEEFKIEVIDFTKDDYRNTARRFSVRHSVYYLRIFRVCGGGCVG